MDFGQRFRRPGRRRRTATLLTVAATAALLGPAAPAVAAPRPNIVFVLTDDLDQRSMWALPTMRAVAERGTTFTRAYVSSPLCSPSRATILTGRYPQNTGVLRNRPPFGGFESFHASGLESETVAVWLRRAGYRTGLVGKYINQFPNTAGQGYIPPGWDYWVSPKGGNYMYNAFNYYLNENGTTRFYGTGPGNYVTDVYAGKARAFIDDAVARGQPFALFLWLPAPHTPEVPAPRHTSLFPAAQLTRNDVLPEWYVADKPSFLRFPPPSAEALRDADLSYRRRLQMMASVDEALASIRRRLDGRGQLDNTYLVFFSDNGWHHAYHNLKPWKGTAYEEDIRVPLVVSGPGVPAGREVDRLVDNADLAPTFAAWAGAEPAPGIDGRSFAGLLQAADPAAVPWRKRLPIYKLTEAVPGPAATWRRFERLPGRAGGYACLGQVPPWTEVGTDLVNLPEYRGVRGERYSYVEYVTGDLELYDREQHPLQQHNSVCAAPAELLADLHGFAVGLSSCSGAACREIEDR
jgi:arylsulfatase A-like enzyme